MYVRSRSLCGGSEEECGMGSSMWGVSVYGSEPVFMWEGSKCVGVNLSMCEAGVSSIFVSVGGLSVWE